MKTHLLNTTAIAAAVLLLASAGANAQSAPPGNFNVGQGAVKLGVGGYMQQVFGFSTNDDSVVGDRVSFDQWSETEIWFKGYGRLPNGLQFLATIELEGNQFNGDQIDESYMDIRGSFGQLTLGSTNNAAYNLTSNLTIHRISVGESMFSSVNNYFAKPAGISGGNRITDQKISGSDIDNDAEKISYITPRFAGFQAGVSYIPENSQDTDAIASEVGQYNTGFAVGLNYNMAFQGGRFGAGVGYLTFDAPSGSTVADPEVWLVAARVDVGQFAVAASYRDADGVLNAASNPAVSLDGDKWGIGGSWNPGPYRVSLVYYSASEEGSVANTADDEATVWQAQIATDLARGVKLFGNLYRVEFEEEAGAENDGWALSAGVRLSF